jgi:hypothetical protein
MHSCTASLGEVSSALLGAQLSLALVRYELTSALVGYELAGLLSELDCYILHSG